MNSLNVRSQYSAQPLTPGAEQIVQIHAQRLAVYAEVNKIALDHLMDLSLSTVGNVAMGLSQINTVEQIMEATESSSPQFTEFTSNLAVVFTQFSQQLFDNSCENSMMTTGRVE